MAGIAEYALPEEEQESSDESDEDGATPKPPVNKKDVSKSKSASAWKRLQLLVGISKKDKSGDEKAGGKKKMKSKTKSKEKEKETAAGR